MSSPADTIKQLNAARDIVLQDAAIYPQVVPGILPVIPAAADVALRRWGADFLAETFASPVLNGEAKQRLCVTSSVLDTIRSYINRKEELGQAEDAWIMKSAIQCAASIYPLVFRHTISTPTDSETWNKMAAIKSSILRKIDFLPPGVKICCIKFLATVVLVQTPGLIADPRRPDQNEISLALLPRDHPTLKVGLLEAEASGLLDRLLGTLQEENGSALYVTATINCLSSLVHRRASISNKIITAILNFNPLRLATKMSTGKDRVYLRSMTRTTTAFLMNVLKREPKHTLGPRIQQQIDRLRYGLGEAFSEANLLKRSAPDEPVDGLDDTKRQRLDHEAAQGSTMQQQKQQFSQVAPLPPGPVTAAQLFDLTNGSGAATFHVELLPANIVAQLVPALIGAVDTAKLDWAINAVRARYLDVTSRPRHTATAIARGVAGEEDDEYDPAGNSGDIEVVLNDMDHMPNGQIDQNIKIGPFHLPPPPPLAQNEAREQSRLVLIRLFGILQEKDKELSKGLAQKATQELRGFNRGSIGPQTREGWVQTIVRIATRASDQEHETQIKEENGDNALTKKRNQFELSTGIRESLFNYVMEDFRKRINDAICWLSDEWYTEKIQQKESGDVVPDEDATPRYDYWTLRFLDAIVPYLDVKDNRTLIRFFSEVPGIDSRHLDRLVKVADDPERVNLAVQTLLYLIMLRPPVRESALDAMETLWRNNEDAKASTEKHLVKWRPHVVQNGEVKIEV